MEWRASDDETIAASCARTMAGNKNVQKKNYQLTSVDGIDTGVRWARRRRAAVSLYIHARFPAWMMTADNQRRKEGGGVGSVELNSAPTLRRYQTGMLGYDGFLGAKAPRRTDSQKNDCHSTCEVRHRFIALPKSLPQARGLSVGLTAKYCVCCVLCRPVWTEAGKTKADQMECSVPIRVLRNLLTLGSWPACHSTLGIAREISVRVQKDILVPSGAGQTGRRPSF